MSLRDALRITYKGHPQVIIQMGGVFIRGLFLGDQLTVFTSMNLEVSTWGSAKYITNVFQ